MRVAFLTANARAGDAIGNLVAQKLAFFLERGADARVFLLSDDYLQPTLRSHAQKVSANETSEDVWDFLTSADLVFVEFGHAHELLEWVPALADGKPRIVFDYHGLTPAALWASPQREALERAAARRALAWCADAVVVHSRFARREILDATGFPDDRCYELSHSLDVASFRAGQGRGLADRLGFGPARIMLFVGRLAPNKRVPMLVDALDRLRDLQPPLRLVLAGDDGDVYGLEAARCKERARELGLVERVHLLGHVAEHELAEAYRSADVFVMPSVHEGFCIPVIEAMASGVPVLAARAGALPETVGNAGLTFAANDVADLTRQVARVLESKVPASGAKNRGPWSEVSADALHVAVVAARYGDGFVGGAETSLRRMAEALATEHRVEVFTTCVLNEDGRKNELREGFGEVDGVRVLRFPIDATDAERYRRLALRIETEEGVVGDEVESAFIGQSLRSQSLLSALRERIHEFDAVITAPYLSGLTADVVREFPEKTLAAPCLHDEPAARLKLWPKLLGSAAGILFHSDEEQELAQTELGINSPGSTCIGTWIDVDRPGDADRGRKLVGGGAPYLVYCGRYVAEKRLPALLDHAQRHCRERPGRFAWAFMGRGSVRIPEAEWARDLGFVDEQTKRDVLSGAAALVHLSRNESLSLACLESWAQGVPVIGDAGSAVLAGHLLRSGAGRAVESYEGFAAALDALWEQPQSWRALGERGRDYVKRCYGTREEFTDRLVRAILEMRVPLAERMRRRGLARAAEHDQRSWKERFGRLVENVLDAPAREYCEDLEVRPRSDTRIVAAGADTVLVPVQLTNRGTHAVVPDGPGKTVVRVEVAGAGERLQDQTALPGVVMPGQTMAAAVMVPVPRPAGVYQVEWTAGRFGREKRDSETTKIRGKVSGIAKVIPAVRPKSTLRLIVEAGRTHRGGGFCGPMLDAVESALGDAFRLQRLPDDYVDVTEGRLAGIKRWIKRKLVANFKRGYVDVLSLQQSTFNQRVVTALNELAGCCGTLASAAEARNGRQSTFRYDLAPALAQIVAAGKTDELTTWVRSILEALAEAREQAATMEERLNQLERMVAAMNARTKDG